MEADLLVSYQRDVAHAGGPCGSPLCIALDYTGCFLDDHPARRENAMGGVRCRSFAVKYGPHFI